MGRGSAPRRIEVKEFPNTAQQRPHAGLQEFPPSAVVLSFLKSVVPQ